MCMFEISLLLLTYLDCSVSFVCIMKDLLSKRQNWLENLRPQQERYKDDDDDVCVLFNCVSVH